MDEDRLVAQGVARRPEDGATLAQGEVLLREDDPALVDVVTALDEPGALKRVAAPIAPLGSRRQEQGVGIAGQDRADVLGVEVIESDQVDVLGAQAQIAELRVHRRVLLLQERHGPLTHRVDELPKERRRLRSLGVRRVPQDVLDPVIGLHLHQETAVAHLDVGQRQRNRAVEGVAGRVEEATHRQGPHGDRSRLLAERVAERATRVSESLDSLPRVRRRPGVVQAGHAPHPRQALVDRLPGAAHGSSFRSA